VKFKLLYAVKTGLFLLVSFMSCVANAKLIKTTMDMEVFQAGPYATVAAGDTFQFIAIYDDESQFAYGFDGSLRCLADYALLHPYDCDKINDKADFLANPTLNIGDLFNVDRMIEDGGAFYTGMRNYASVPFSIAFRNIEPDVQGNKGITFRYLSKVTYSVSVSLLYPERIAFQYLDKNGILKVSQILYTISNVNSVPLNVPEPSTLAVFALGIMGLASRRFKKQS